MGFFVDPFQKPSTPQAAGRDYVPPDDGYKPVINNHTNHSNLEGQYDPRRNLVAGGFGEDAPGGRRRERLVVLALAAAVLMCVVLAIALYLLSGA